MSHFLDPIVSSCQSLFSWQTPPVCAHAKVCFSKIYTVGDFTRRGESLKKSSTLDTLENKKQNKTNNTNRRVWQVWPCSWVAAVTRPPPPTHAA